MLLLKWSGKIRFSDQIFFCPTELLDALIQDGLPFWLLSPHIVGDWDQENHTGVTWAFLFLRPHCPHPHITVGLRSRGMGNRKLVGWGVETWAETISEVGGVDDTGG